MKVYVYELPKCCAKCPCESDRWCNLMGYVVDEDEYDDKKPTQCPLQSLTDYTKQVRKEVCEEIKDLAGNYFELPYCDNCGETNNDDVILTGNDLTEILDQIQGDKVE